MTQMVFHSTFERVRERKAPRLRPVQPPREPERRPAGVAIMLAQAIQLQDRLDRGELGDLRAVAKELGVSPGQATILMNLTLLAPDIQEQVLALEAVAEREPLYENQLRPVLRERSWARQREVWRGVMDRGG